MPLIPGEGGRRITYRESDINDKAIHAQQSTVLANASECDPMHHSLWFFLYSDRQAGDLILIVSRSVRQ